MFENTLDLAGYDLIWRDKPDLPAANEENRKLEEEVKLGMFNNLHNDFF